MIEGIVITEHPLSSRNNAIGKRPSRTFSRSSSDVKLPGEIGIQGSSRRMLFQKMVRRVTYINRLKALDDPLSPTTPIVAAAAASAAAAAAAGKAHRP